MIIDKTVYNSIHQWNLRHWVKKGVCDFCEIKTKTQWSNISGNYLKGVRSDWQELCVKCHIDFDKRNRDPKLIKKIKSEIVSCRICSKDDHKSNMRYILFNKIEVELCSNCLKGMMLYSFSPKDKCYKKR